MGSYFTEDGQGRALLEATFELRMKVTAMGVPGGKVHWAQGKKFQRAQSRKIPDILRSNKEASVTGWQ